MNATNITTKGNNVKVEFALPEISGDLLPVVVIYDIIEGKKLGERACLVTVVERGSGIYSDFNYDLKEAIKELEGCSIDEFKIN